MHPWRDSGKKKMQNMHIRLSETQSTRQMPSEKRADSDWKTYNQQLHCMPPHHRVNDFFCASAKDTFFSSFSGLKDTCEKVM